MGANTSIPALEPLPKRTRVIVADPYPVIVHGIRKMVEDDPRFQVVAEASTMPSFSKNVIAAEPEIALVDWSMASQDLAATRALIQSISYTPSTIFLTVSENSEAQREMLKLGACEFLSKWTSARKLQKALFKACHGRMAIESSVAEAGLTASLSTPASADSEPPSFKRLTRRERELLPLVCSGLKNKEIAVQLGIAETTVWHHLTSVFTKLQVEDRLGVAAFVYRHNLVPADDRLPTVPRKPVGVASPTAGPHPADHARAPGPRAVEPSPALTLRDPPATLSVKRREA